MSENNGAIVKVDVRAIAHNEDVTYRTYDGCEITLNLGALQKILPGAKNGTPYELAAFMSHCISERLNPFKRQIYFIKYGQNDPPAWPVAWDVFMDRAQRHPGFDGIESGIIWMVDGKKCRGKACDYIEDAAHVVAGGWATAYRKDRKMPVDVERPLGEIVQTKRDGSPVRSWRSMKLTMTEKCAKAMALRMAFPEMVGGLVADVEPYLPCPEYTQQATDAPTRQEFQETQQLPVMRLAKQMADALREAAGQEPDQATIERALADLVSRVCPDAPLADLQSPAAWTDEIVEACSKELDKCGVDPIWLPQTETADA